MLNHKASYMNLAASPVLEKLSRPLRLVGGRRFRAHNRCANSQKRKPSIIMKVKWKFFERLHLDSQYGVLNARSAFLVWEVFKLLDWRGKGSLDDVQFASFLTMVTDLKEAQAMKVFDIFDLDRSGSVEFDEFYLLTCILVAITDNQGKQFMYQHWRTCFEVLDEDGSKAVSLKEFETLGFLFNFTPHAIRQIYGEFDINGTKELDNSEFRLFVLAAMDYQSVLESKSKEKSKTFRQRFWIQVQKFFGVYSEPMMAQLLE
ncbi:uncharacterized protein BJ171DRAFT_494411 [Polychytrium aggregatum]|uniref:uncharacterized protein n=1 Tax=Polychytrium aggregatum TaxID=110093 RepID=UPI0022FECEDA|nr:uncharacterized protein BJ171DRAFT_494411 [Polychytrium aggregatum]KAI9207364.1 hypothetical protein BJ171DRAFT_494411 [Polychytrium aggregatum]